MPSNTRMMRLGIWLATTSLSLTAALPAAAQPAPPDAAQSGAAQPGAELAGDQGSDPPALAGRVSAITGSVSFHNSGETQWSAATLNYPVTNGQSFWTEPQGQTTLEIADDRVVLAGSTELDVSALDMSQFTTTAAQGAVFVQLNSLPQGQTVTINTPRGAVQLNAVGRYEIVAGDTNDATLVTVVDGSAHVSGTNLSLDVGPQQTASIGGTDTLQGSVGPIQTDAFLQNLLRAPAGRAFAASVRRQVQYMTGASDLQTYGSFTQTAQYGQVWYPSNMPANWAPYRDGHWSYVHPWGWTWVDNARWGFAPFHYGRWAQVDNRWGWVPGGGEDAAAESPYPVYSPALVSFVDVGVGAGIGVSIGAGFGGGYAPAWVPLGPREPYYPWYHCRPSYFSRLNTPYGVPRTIIDRGPTYNNTTITRNVYINERAATVIPAAAFARGQSVASFGRPLPAADFARARPLVGRLAVAPTPQTPNLPREAARRYKVALPATPVQRVTAGPRIAPEQGRAHGAPELRRAALPVGIHAVPAAQVHTGQPVAGEARQGPHGPEARQEPGRGPALRPGEARPGEPGRVAHEPAAQPGSLPPLRNPGAGRPAVEPGGRLETRPGVAAPAGRPEVGGRNAAEPHDGQAGRPPVAGGARGAEPGRVEPGRVEPGRGEQTRLPGARPDAAAPGRQTGQTEAERRASAPTDRHEPPAANRAAEEPHAGPNVRAPQPARPADVPHAAPPARPVPPRAEPRPAPRPEARPPHAEAPRPPPRAEPPHAEAPRPAPHAEAPRPQAPRPAPHAEPARPAPRPEPARQAPRPEPRPQVHQEPPHAAPRPAAPRPEPARPAPHAEAPHPAPHPAEAHPGKEPPKH